MADRHILLIDRFKCEESLFFGGLLFIALALFLSAPFASWPLWF